MKCFFHDDLDGRCAAAIVKKSYPDCVCQAVNYEIPFPVDMIKRDELVFIVDFTPNKKEEFDAIIKKADKLIWIDHHGSNITKYPEQDKEVDGVRVSEKPSGAMLTWKYLHGDEPAPLAVFLTSDFDTWTHSDKRSEPFNAGMTVIDHAPGDSVWDVLLGRNAGDISEMFGEKSEERSIDGIVLQGKIILDYRAVTARENLLRFGYETEFEGLKAVACCNDEKGSRFFEDYLDRYDLAIAYCHNGKEFIFGLYSKKDEVDCAALAKKHGGGGHKGAAGFQGKELPFKPGRMLRETT